MQVDLEDMEACDAPAESLHSAVVALVGLVRDGVLVCAGDDVVYANSVAAALLGGEGDARALLGTKVSALLTPPPQVADGSPQTSKVLGLRCEHRSPGTRREHQAPGTRRERRVEVRSRACGDFVMHVLVDLDEQARPHSALIETSRDLYEARLESAALRSSLDAEVEERRELIAVVAHELRTPITVIRGYARLLLSGEAGELNAVQRKFIAVSSQSCDRLDDFVEMLLRASDAQRAADGSHFSDASLANLLAGVVEFMRPLIDESGMRLELELDPEALWAHFDAARIEQVLANLISNGLKYAQQGGVITIRTRIVTNVAASGEASVEVSVSDRGPGISAESSGVIFDPYVRGEGSSAVPGVGLGLAICRRIVEAHGGSIDLSEEPGGGCRFAFTLAAAEPKDPVEDPDSGNSGDR